MEIYLWLFIYSFLSLWPLIAASTCPVSERRFMSIISRPALTNIIPQRMDIDSTSNVYVCGLAYHNQRSIVYKISADGQTYPFVWEFGSYDSQCIAIKVAPDSLNLYIGGWSNNLPFSLNTVSLSYRDAYLIKMDATAGVIFAKVFGNVNTHE